MDILTGQSFKSITQYDKRFDGMFEKIKNKGYSCSYFGVLSCLRFLQGYTPNVDTHEKNIIDAMMITCMLNINSGLSFDDLITGCTNYDNKKIMGTSVELIVNNVIGKNEMFPKLINEKEKYAVIFLKNEKYFVVLVDKNGFYLRDCHVDTQNNFKTCDELFEHLSNYYQFTKMINIDGFKLEDYSSIEFLIFDQQFESGITGLIEPQINNSHKSDHKGYLNSQHDSGENIDNIKFIEPTVEQNKKREILNGDMFDVPSNVLFSKKDIEYLELLNYELLNCSDKKPDVKILDSIPLVFDNPYSPTNFTTSDEILLLELQKEIEEYDNDQFEKTLLFNSNPDELVNFQ